MEELIMRNYANWKVPKQHYDELNERVAALVELYYVNNRVPVENFEEKMTEQLVDLLKWAKKTVVFYHEQNFTELTKRFDKYIWHFERGNYSNLDMFKVIGYLSRIIDEDEYYFK